MSDRIGQDCPSSDVVGTPNPNYVPGSMSALHKRTVISAAAWLASRERDRVGREAGREAREAARRARGKGDGKF